MVVQALAIGIVGPVPPPAGGMAGQTRQLCELLASEGIRVALLPVNPPYSPEWIGRLHGIRAACRLIPFCIRLWLFVGRVDVLHVMANSGWSWHLFAAPAVWIARLRGVPVVVNYRGGEAGAFLAHAPRIVHRTLSIADALTVPSGFLRQVFEGHGIRSEIVPNVIDLARFRPTSGPSSCSAPHVVVARNLETLYDVATALRAFAPMVPEFEHADGAEISREAREFWRSQWAGRSFMAGADLKWLNTVRAGTLAENDHASRMTAEAIDRFNRLPVPTVALVQGFCVGGATGLVAAADVAIASEDAKFAISEVRWGLTAAIIIPPTARVCQ